MARYTMPGAYSISRQTFKELDDLIRSLRVGSREFVHVMDLSARLMAHTTQGFALRYYRGPKFPGGHAGTVPVRQITGTSGSGWIVRKVAPGAWECANETRGAWMVEHGIVKGGGGVRRPILRMSGIATLRFIQRSRFGERIMAETFGSLRDNKGRFRSFTARMQGSNLLAAPMVTHTAARSSTRVTPMKWQMAAGIVRRGRR